MLMQRSLSPRVNQVSERDAAAQRAFPEAVIQHSRNRQNPNQPFAAPASYVLDADKPA